MGNSSNVRPRIAEAFGRLNSLDVVVFEPQPVPNVQRTVRSLAVPKVTPGRVALVGLMDRYLDGLLNPFVTLLKAHKLIILPAGCGRAPVPSARARQLLAGCGRAPQADWVAQLVAGFESSFGLELLSTVHWVLEYEKPQSQDKLVADGTDEMRTRRASHAARLSWQWM
ncbi:hypothetical protein [Candidatus Synechococcus spongiarum]|nr:hypothetical protein [Candidatus Synechococcus spongiarum]